MENAVGNINTFVVMRFDFKLGEHYKIICLVYGRKFLEKNRFAQRYIHIRGSIIRTGIFSEDAEVWIAGRCNFVPGTFPGCITAAQIKALGIKEII
jgi:hypothetical protein